MNIKKFQKKFPDKVKKLLEKDFVYCENTKSFVWKDDPRVKIREDGEVEVQMEEKWVTSELQALRSTLNVMMTGTNKNSQDINDIKQEMLDPVIPGRRLWDGIDNRVEVVKDRINEYQKEMEEKFDKLSDALEKAISVCENLMEENKTLRKDLDELATKVQAQGFIEKLKEIGTPITQPISPTAPYKPPKPYTFGDDPLTGNGVFMCSSEPKLKALTDKITETEE